MILYNLVHKSLKIKNKKNKNPKRLQQRPQSFFVIKIPSHYIPSAFKSLVLIYVAFLGIYEELKAICTKKQES